MSIETGASDRAALPDPMPQLPGKMRLPLLRTVIELAGEALWRVPERFSIARVLDSRYSLRCVLFHHVAAVDSAFTRGLNCTIAPDDLAAALKFLAANYTVVSLQDVLDSMYGSKHLPARPVLVTFDDAYASVCKVARPLCSNFGIEATFFVNAAFLDNRRLALDNLVCYVANEFGLEPINGAIQKSSEWSGIVRSLSDVFGRFLPAISLSSRNCFYNQLLELTRTQEMELADRAGLYLSSEQLRELVSSGFEIGNHTWSHVNCRSLQVDEFADELDHNKEVLESVTNKKVRSFSVPYGSSIDLTEDLQRHLESSGHEAMFLAEAGTNDLSNPHRLNRVSTSSGVDATLFSQIEVLPRLRNLRNSLRHRVN